ncbi:MAG: hypothetical protein ISS94_01500 [Candidatus Syntrophoarchaeum sp.]|nr:hypothetical protein [Methanomicrobia archaeon]MBL7117448.1 hypothetical protein [Candidatus Syntrophoarchaeum sp.]
MNVKKVLLFIALVSAIAVALSQTVSLFGGQHTWYDLGPAGSDVPCSKCHADICGELSVSGVHQNLGSGSEACAACHRCNLTCYTNASGEGAGSTPGKEVHAASTVPCMECHEVDTWSPYAGGFTNKTNSLYQYADAAHNGTKAAHNVFVQSAVNGTLMEDSNEACIQCHTNVAVDITYHIPRGYEIELNRTCGWNVNLSYYNFTDVEVRG